jgi:hypothetical protein
MMTNYSFAENQPFFLQKKIKKPKCALFFFCIFHKNNTRKPRARMHFGLVLIYRLFKTIRSSRANTFFRKEY